MEILRGIRDTYDRDVANEDEDPDVIAAVMENSGVAVPLHNPSYKRAFRDRDIVANIESKKSMFRWADGTSTVVNWNFRERYLDEYTREELPHAEIKAAIVDEMGLVQPKRVGWCEVCRGHEGSRC